MRAARLLAALLGTLVVTAPANGLEAERKFVLVVVDGVLWPDWEQAGGPALGTLTHTGAVGLMNVRTVWPITPESAYLTIGAGSRAVAPEQSVALQVGERHEGSDAVSAFESRSGKIPPHGGAVYLPIAAAMRLNDPRQLRYICRPGLLGSALAEAGLTAACVGNADLARGLRRDVVTIAMDRDGIVPVAAVGRRLTRPAEAFAPGIETDFAALLQAFDRAASDAQFVAVETGDTARLHAVEDEVVPEVLAQERRRRLLRVDGFLEALLKRAQGKPWRILVVTPTPPFDPERTPDAMTPIIMAGWGVKPGLLTSPSTRTDGVVANTDIAATVLEFLGVEVPADAVGRPMTVTARPSSQALSTVLMLDRRLAADDRNRPVVRDTFKTVVVIILALSCLGLLLDERTPGSLAGLLRGLSLFVLAWPLALLALKVFDPETLVGTLVAMFAIAVVWAVVVSLPRRGWLWVSVATAAVIAIDLLGSQRWVWGSVLGYSPTVGARYYGLGNEYGGVMLAAVPIGVLGLLSGESAPKRWQRLLAGLALVGAVAVVGHPGVGANLGIALACVVGFAVGWMLLAAGGVSARRGIAIGLAAVVLLGIAFAADALRGGGASHIGRALAGVGSGGPEAFADIVVRRTTRNWVLVQRSAWSGPAFLGLTALVIAVVAAPRRVHAALAERRGVMAALGGVAAGAIAAFVLNDSGIVSAALALSYGAALLTYLSFSERLDRAGPR